MGRRARREIYAATTSAVSRVNRRKDVLCPLCLAELVYTTTEQLWRDGKVRLDIVEDLVVLLVSEHANGEKKTHVVDYADIVALAKLPPLAEALGRWAAVSPGVLAHRLR